MSTRPVLLDLFCGAGGAAMGYHRAGFTVVGVDINPQPRYPFEFRLGDSLDFLSKEWGRFDCVHASPPCQLFSHASIQDGLGRRRNVSEYHVDLIGPTRDLLRRLDIRLWAMENVPKAPLQFGVLLCGKMFGMPLVRHRVFECHGFRPTRLPHKRHVGRTITVAGNSGGSSRRDGVKFGSSSDRREAMGIYWMSNRELVEAVPPAYTEHIGRDLLRALRRDYT